MFTIKKLKNSENSFINRYKDEKVWLLWSPKLIKDKNNNEKLTKVPLGSSTDPNTWDTFIGITIKKKEIKENTGVGIVFPPHQRLVGVDIDKVITINTDTDTNIDTITFSRKEKEKEITDFIKKANTYTEVSPSGTGFHLFFEVVNPFQSEDEETGYSVTGGNKKEPYELYSKGRFFTFTGKTINNAPVAIVSSEELDDLLKMIGYPFKKEPTKEELDQKKASIPSSNPNTLKLDDDEVLRRMFLAKNGEEIKILYNGDTTKYNNDESSADMALVQSLLFWTGGDEVQTERLWLISPLGNRAKTQTREDYRKRTIDNTLKVMNDFYEAKPLHKGVLTIQSEQSEQSEQVESVNEVIDFDFLYVERGKDRIKSFSMNVENVARILRKHPKYRNTLRFDEFRNEYEICVKGSWRPLEDTDTSIIQTQISIEFEFMRNLGKTMTYEAIILVSKENAFDSAKHYLENLVWDGTPRLSEWLYHTYGCPLDVYHVAVAENWMKGLVSRLIYPGCKFDYVLAIEGEQGTRKSTSLNILGMNGKWHTETTMSTESKDFFMQFNGNAIIEFSEGETLSRTEVKRMKAIITTQIDKYRPPFERMTKEFPRRCVFAMTTNQYEYLKDETGNRRWFPIRVVLPVSNTEWLAENRDQLYAEAYYRVKVLKEIYYNFPAKEVEEQQSTRRIKDENAGIVEEWYWNRLTRAKREEGVTILDVLKGVFGKDETEMIKKYDEIAIGNILRLDLGLDKIRVMKNGVRKNYYVMPEGSNTSHPSFVDMNEVPANQKDTEQALQELWDSVKIKDTTLIDIPDEDF